MTIQEEKQFRIECGAMAAEIALAKLGLIKDEINQTEAFRVFGQGNIRSWVNEGILTRVKRGNNNASVFYSRIECETIAKLKANRKLK